MSASKDFVLSTMKQYGKNMATEVQNKAEEMTGTELNGKKGFIPSFVAACAKMNMLERPVGFVCKSSAGRIVKLLQVYDSTIYTQEPEELPAQWRFVWSKDPKHALPFLKSAENPYDVDECCIWNGEVYASTIPSNTYTPDEYAQGWKKVEVTE